MFAEDVLCVVLCQLCFAVPECLSSHTPLRIVLYPQFLLKAHVPHDLIIRPTGVCTRGQPQIQLKASKNTSPWNGLGPWEIEVDTGQPRYQLTEREITHI